MQSITQAIRSNRLTLAIALLVLGTVGYFAWVSYFQQSGAATKIFSTSASDSTEGWQLGYRNIGQQPGPNAPLSQGNGRLPTLGFKGGGTYANGAQVCYTYRVPANTTVTKADFFYNANEAGTTGVAVQVNGQQVSNISVTSEPTDNGSIARKHYTAHISASTGQTIEICNTIINGTPLPALGGGLGRTLAADRYAQLIGFNLVGTREVADAQVTLRYDVSAVSDVNFTMKKDSKKLVTLKIANRGNSVWKADPVGGAAPCTPGSVSNPLRLGGVTAANGKDRVSAFGGGQGWLFNSGGRIVSTDGRDVSPGQVATYVIEFDTKNVKPGKYTERFRPVIECSAWLEDGPQLVFNITVTPPAAGSNPTSSPSSRAPAQGSPGQPPSPSANATPACSGTIGQFEAETARNGGAINGTALRENESGAGCGKALALLKTNRSLNISFKITQPQDERYGLAIAARGEGGNPRAHITIDVTGNNRGGSQSFETEFANASYLTRTYGRPFTAGQGDTVSVYIAFINDNGPRNIIIDSASLLRVQPRSTNIQGPIPSGFVTPNRIVDSNQGSPRQEAESF